jgi:tetratricopeptide (TPR) repeat protein
MRNALLALAVAASLSLAAKTSLAQPPAHAPTPAQPTPDQARADAHKRLGEGLDRYGRGDYDGARLAFEQAYAVLASVDLLYNLARAEVKSGHALEALVHIRQILRDPKATADDHTKAARLLDDANRVTAHVAIEAPAGAEIVIDHVPSGDAPVNEPFDVTPGKHVCEARANGTARVIEVTASIGDVVTARFALPR